MASKRSVTALVIGFVTMTAIGAAAQEQFYRGKTVRIVVGFSAGGGFDAYSRAIARHLSQHVPGNPTIVVKNMSAIRDARLKR
jgi:tripartite-type tricarboxylate transporter receptor subunit TctC